MSPNQADPAFTLFIFAFLPYNNVEGKVFKMKKGLIRCPQKRKKIKTGHFTVVFATHGNEAHGPGCRKMARPIIERRKRTNSTVLWKIKTVEFSTL